MTAAEQQLQGFIAEAHQLGITAAKNAASWVTDGNASGEHYAHLLRMMNDGDPQLFDYLPTMPNLSGEWADDLTPIRLYEEVTGLDHAEAQDDAGLGYETLVGSVVDAIANAWEEAVSETFQTECERLVYEALADDTTCGTCGRTWNQYVTPTPSARCPFEYDHEDEN